MAALVSRDEGALWGHSVVVTEEESARLESAAAAAIEPLECIVRKPAHSDAVSPPDC